MKTPKYWQSNSLISKLLYPIGAVYGVLTQARLRFVKPKKAEIPVICVGNITVPAVPVKHQFPYLLPKFLIWNCGIRILLPVVMADVCKT